MNKNLYKILVCPVCKVKLLKRGNTLICRRNHIYQIDSSVPILSNLDSYLEVEAKAWEDEWKKGVSQEALRAYKYNMKIFKKLKFWEESGEASKDIPTNKDSYVLDLACGNGVSTANIKGKVVVGLDLSAKQMIRAKNKFKNTNFVMGDAENLPFKEETFDFVIAVNMLHHVYHPSRVLSEVYRVLKKGGKLLSVDPNLYNPIGFVGRGLYKFFKLKKIFPTFPQFALGDEERQFTKGEYVGLFRKSPFKNFIIKPHRIERILFFATIIFPFLVKAPGYEKLLIAISKFSDRIVQIRPFDRICYFWMGEATK